MPTATISKRTAILISAVVAIRAAPASAAPAEGQSTWSDHITPIAEWALDWITFGHATAPTLTLVLAVLVALPPLALIGLFVRRRTRSRTRPAPEAPPLVEETAALVLAGDASKRLPLGAGIVRIGRHEENDLRLLDKTVHRFHAVLHWSPEERFVITDISGPEGNGVVLNGARIRQHALAGGDVIEIGHVKLRFEAERLAA